MDKISRFLLPLFLVMGMVSVANAQELQESFETTKYKIQSVYMYNFTKYIQWPDSYNQGDFVVAVMGESPINDELLSMSEQKQVNGRSMKVVQVNSLDEISQPIHMLYIPSDESPHLGDALQLTRNEPTLIITNKEGMGRVGSMINFVTKNGRPTFEMNISALDQRNLVFEQQLKTIAIVI